MSASKLHFFTPEEVLVINTSSLLSLSKIHCAVFFLFRSTVSSNLEHLTRKGLSNLAQTIFHEKKNVGGFSVFHDQTGIAHRMKCTEIAVKEGM